MFVQLIKLFSNASLPLSLNFCFLALTIISVSITCACGFMRVDCVRFPVCILLKFTFFFIDLGLRF